MAAREAGEVGARPAEEEKEAGAGPVLDGCGHVRGRPGWASSHSATAA